MEDFKNAIIFFSLLAGAYFFFTGTEIGQYIVVNVLHWFHEHPIFND